MIQSSFISFCQGLKPVAKVDSPFLTYCIILQFPCLKPSLNPVPRLLLYCQFLSEFCHEKMVVRVYISASLDSEIKENSPPVPVYCKAVSLILNVVVWGYPGSLMGLFVWEETASDH